jgi:hypothetical protein
LVPCDDCGVGIDAKSWVTRHCQMSVDHDGGVAEQLVLQIEVKPLE